MVTPEKIKQGLEACVAGECNGKGHKCPYRDEGECTSTLAKDALAYIQQLEEELAATKDRESGLSIMLTSAQSAAETYKRELDAAMADINMCCPCEVCTRSCTYDKVNPYDECADFEWRGLPEPPKEET